MPTAKFDSLFREYDIRGLLADDELTLEAGELIIRAYAALLVNRGIHRCVVGYDNRKDSPAYAEMAVKVLERVRDEVEARYPMVRLALAHRTGRLEVGEVSVVTCCSAPHRREAFAACRLAMDRIKEVVPVWKREETVSDGSRWV